MDQDLQRKRSGQRDVKQDYTTTRTGEHSELCVCVCICVCVRAACVDHKAMTTHNAFDRPTFGTRLELIEMVGTVD